MAILGSGDVGIGTPTPSTYGLDILKNLNSDVGLLIKNTNSGSSGHATVALRNDIDQEGKIWMNSSGAGSPNSLNIGTTQSNPLTLLTGNSARLTITSAGKIGIGTLSPAEQLHVLTGNIMTGVANPALESLFSNSFIYSTSSAGAGVGNFGNTGFLLASSSTKQGAFYYSGSSTTLDAYSNALLLQNTNGSITLGPAGNTSLSKNLVVAESITTTNGNITSGGNFIATGGYTYVSSDRRLKDEIEAIEDVEKKILKLRPVKFRWKKTNKRDFGFIAQEIAEVIPEITGTGPNKMMYVDYTKIIPFLVDQIQRQQKEIQKQQKEIDILKKKVK